MARSKTRRHAGVALFAVLFTVSAAWLSARAQEEGQLPQASEQHKLLAEDVGTWDAVMKIFLQEGAPPMESKGTEKNELLPGGMWLVSRFQSDFAGMPFTGMGTIGYDPVEKKYVGTWVDSISPHLSIMKGDYDPATKTMATIAEGRDFATGKVMQSRHVSRHVDENTRAFEMYAQEEGGKERKVMEIQYKRRAM